MISNDKIWERQQVGWSRRVSQVLGGGKGRRRCRHLQEVTHCDDFPFASKIRNNLDSDMRRFACLKLSNDYFKLILTLFEHVQTFKAVQTVFIIGGKSSCKVIECRSKISECSFMMLDLWCKSWSRERPKCNNTKAFAGKNAMYIIYCSVFTSKMLQGIFGTSCWSVRQWLSVLEAESLLDFFVLFQTDNSSTKQPQVTFCTLAVLQSQP